MAAFGQLAVARANASRILALCITIIIGCVPACGAQDVRAAEFPVLRDSARLLLNKGNAQEAATLFGRLARADTENGSYLLGLAASKQRLGEFHDAINALKGALALGSGQRRFRSYQIAQLFARSGARDSALTWLGRALVAGYEARPEIAQDSAFVTLFEDSAFQRLALRVPVAPSRVQGWRSDLATLVEEAKRLSPRFDSAARTPAFDSAAAAIAAAIPSYSDEQVYAAMQRLITMLGSGHSVVFPLPTPHLTLKMLPLDFYLFTDGMYVVGAEGAGAIIDLVGARIDSINGVASVEALRRMTPLIDRDNAMGIVWNGPYFLTYPAMLGVVGIGSSLDSARLVVRDRAGAIRRVTLSAGELRPPSKLMPPPGRAGTTPLYLRHPNKNYWFEPLPLTRSIYAQYNQVADDSTWSVAQFADSLLRTARRLGTQQILLDVRRNNGGSSDLNRALLRALIQFEGFGPQHQVYVLVGRNTFSAAQNFINAVERWTDALFVGEPSSSRPNFIGEDTEVLLPYSGITGTVASRYFQDSDPLDDRTWIAPDIPVRMSSGDYFGGKDPVLDAALEHIRLVRR
jgi:hypothetical protein